MLRLPLASLRPLAQPTVLSSTLRASQLNVARRQFSTNGFFKSEHSKILSRLNSMKSPSSMWGMKGARSIMTEGGPQIVQQAPGVSWQRIALTAAGVAGTVFVIDSFLNRETRDSLTAAERSLLNDSFKYTGGGLLLTAAAARGLFRSGFTFRLMAANPWLVLGVSLVGSIGTMMGTLYTPPEKTVQKHLFWLGFNACQAATLSPLFFFSPAILARAALYTVGVVGAISYVGATATNDKYLHLGGPLLAGITVVALSSLAPMVLPVGMRGLALAESISLYGGLAVFSGFVLYDTQKILQHARLAEQGLMKADPLNESVSLELDMINIFIRLVQILSMQQNKRK